MHTETPPETRGRRFLRWLNTQTSAAVVVTVLALVGAATCITLAANAQAPAQSFHTTTMTEGMVGKLAVDGSGTVWVPTGYALASELSVLKMPKPGDHISYWELESNHDVAETRFPAPSTLLFALLAVGLIVVGVAGIIVGVRRYRRWLDHNPDMRLPN